MASASSDATAVVSEAMTGELQYLPPFWREQVESALRGVFWEGYAFGLADEIEPVLDVAS